MSKCYQCVYRGDLPGDCHSQCMKGLSALNGKTDMPKVKGSDHGIMSGWFFWPFNFDPIWLESCNSFKAKEAA